MRLNGKLSPIEQLIARDLAEYLLSNTPHLYEVEMERYYSIIRGRRDE
ncbi:hypothetical protein KEJ47_10520 [Candidatus Bathyarchaeota archaeon]|nr:hypothetical protein [Candidatus Bathyarchaeota archaeon]